MKFSIEKSDEAIRGKINKFIFHNFYFGSRVLIILAFLTPHGSQIATTVAILSPALPQGESYGTESFETITKIVGV
jgi:hypothetical protein